MKKQFHFLSGLPRSGSTVLSAILNQNPAIYVTPTSPLLDQLFENQNIWHGLQTVKANPIPEQLTNITRRLIDGMWQHVPQNIIIDKHRGWGKNMTASTILFGQEIKMIATTRDIPSIMASWLTILRNNPNSYMDRKLFNMGLRPTDENYMNEMWENMVKDCVEALQQAKKDASNRLLIIHYNDLMEKPTECLNQIETFLQLPKYNYDIYNIVSNTVDDDLAAWGLDGMHKIRSILKKTAKAPEEILGDKLYDKFMKIDQLYKGE